MNESSLVAYDYRESHKKSQLKIIKIEYVRGCPKWLATQIQSLEILGIKSLNCGQPRIFVHFYILY
jgi:hypothetical protein